MSKLVISRIAVFIGALVTLATAAFHLTGYRSVAELVARAQAGPFMTGGLQGLWLMFSMHLFLLALAAIFVTLRITNASRSVLTLCTVLLAADVLVLFAYVGAFIGAFLLAFAVTAIAIGTVFLPQPVVANGRAVSGDAV